MLTPRNTNDRFTTTLTSYNAVSTIVSRSYRLMYFGPRESFFLWRCDPTRVMASSFLRFLDHTQRRTTVGITSLDEWSARRRDLYLTTRNTHNRQTSMPPGTHDLCRRAAADLRLRPRGHWDRPSRIIVTLFHWQSLVFRLNMIHQAFVTGENFEEEFVIFIFVS